MTGIGRRQFCAGLAGLSAVWSTGCSSGGDASTSSSAAADGVLAGLSFEVRRDPG